MLNPLALDILLAKEGDVCKVLKVKRYCTFIPDDSPISNFYIRNLKNVSRELQSLEEHCLWESYR